MKNEKTAYKLVVLTILLILCLVSACNYFNEPPVIYDPNQKYPVDPVVSSISPQDSAVAGVREITVSGTNFITNFDSINLYFGSQISILKSATSTELVAYRPPNYGDSLIVKVEIPSRLGIARIYHYKLEQPVIKWGDFSKIARAFYAMEMDNQGRGWLSSHRYIYKLSADGLYASLFMKDDLLKTAFNEPTECKIGPGGLLYLETKSNKTVYYINPNDSTQAPGTYAVLPNNAEKMDFDENGNLFTGKSNGLYRVDTGGNVTATGRYTTNFTFVAIRVFNQFVYVASTKSIYKTLINPDGTLDTGEELVVSITDAPGLSACTINSFDFATDGTLYLCLQNHPQYSIFILENDGSISPFYHDNILPKGVDQIFWGNGRYLFLNKGKGETTDSLRGVYRMGLNKDGAPYYGRDLP
jgi:hypothetical protein